MPVAASAPAEVGRRFRWGLPNTLYFADGIASETHGLFAALSPIPEPTSLALLAALGLMAVRRTWARHHSAERRLEPPPSIVMIEPVV